MDPKNKNKVWEPEKITEKILLSRLWKEKLLYWKYASYICIKIFNRKIFPCVTKMIKSKQMHWY